MKLFTFAGAVACLLCFLIACSPCWAGAQAFALPVDDSPGYPPLPEGYASELSYRDPSIEITIETGRAYSTDYWVARIKVAHPSQLRTTAATTFDSSRTTSGKAMAKRMQAVLAINGDYFSYINDGYLIRQGVLYRELPRGVRDVLLIDAQGDFHIAIQATMESLAPFKQMDIVNSFNFGPGLVINGDRVKRFFNNDNAANEGRQRMAIAQIMTGSLAYIAVACAGPKGDNTGMTLEQFSKVLADLGVENAYNLDGGNSTMMLFKGVFINALHETTMRPLSDIIYFASASAPQGE
jgi:exopolysaccharide biosynthesis protein